MKSRFLAAVFLLLCLTMEVYGQQRTFQFIPETVYPLGMRSRQVTAEFLLKVSPDTIVCYLPYFGEATGADYASRKSSTDFTSVQFGYTESKGKKGATIATITPRDNRDVRNITVTYYSNDDYANVTITFNQRQSISYRGRIQMTDAGSK